MNRGRHLCSAGRPSRWALAYISRWVEVLRPTRHKTSHFGDISMPTVTFPVGSFSLTLLAGWQAGHRASRKPASQIPKVCFCNSTKLGPTSNTESSSNNSNAVEYTQQSFMLARHDSTTDRWAEYWPSADECQRTSEHLNYVLRYQSRRADHALSLETIQAITLSLTATTSCSRLCQRSQN